MSHLKERTEKNCLNCNAVVAGKYCQVCGQENIEPKESALHLVNHFFQDITHFDGKFFSSLSLLIRKPGFLSLEYNRGRRASYLNPIRMYIFTSFIFFLVFFSISHMDENKVEDAFLFNGKTIPEIKNLQGDSLAAFSKRINNGVAMTQPELIKYVDSVKHESGIHFTTKLYKSKAEYDSILASGIKKHNWFERMLIHKEIEINEKYGNSRKQFSNAFITVLVHTFPQMLFVSLPLFALILTLLYRRQKAYYYVSHGIFSIHLYVFVFITFLTGIGLGKIFKWVHWNITSFVELILLILIFFYQYKAMRNFYQQGRGKTILKFFLLNFISLLMMIVLLTFFVLFSFLKI